jgi:N-acetylmuramoyl-L-alanine amidase
MKIYAVALAALLSVVSFASESSAQNSSLIQKARQAYLNAQDLESELISDDQADPSREDYLRAIRAYQRVYLITPETSYADDALMKVAKLYEEIEQKRDAIRTLNFLVREYPGSPFKKTAQEKVLKLEAPAAAAAVTPPAPSALPTPPAHIESELSSADPDSPVASEPPPISTSAEQRTGAVENIEYWEGQNSVRVVVAVSGPVKFKQGSVKNPDRIFLDISPARLDSQLIRKQWPIASGLLKQIRVGQYDLSTVRVVLDAGAVSRVTSFTLRDPDRLVIDVLGTGTATTETAAVRPETNPATPPRAPAAAPTPAPVPAPAVVAVAVPAPVAVPVPAPAPPPDKVPVAEARIITPVITPAKPPAAGTRSLIRSLGLKLGRVVIDAGHGGHDTGTIGPTGYTEKDMVLDIAVRLKQLIETGIGAEVVMTRTDDSFVPLEARTAIANQQGSDLFISIHANSSRVKSVRGVETYFLNFTSSREALETASRENASSERTIHELQDLVKKIMLRDKVDESREFAEHLQRAMASRKGAGTDRGVKQAPFLVLVGANMPSILAEVGFISNPQEERLIRTPQHRQAIAESLFEGVRSYAESLSGLKTAEKQDKDPD